jgi:hypothetical protein
MTAAFPKMRFRALVAVTAAVLTLAGCAGDGASEALTPSTSASLPAASSETAGAETTESSETGPPRSPRGNIIKSFGEEGGIFDMATQEKLVLTHVVDSITPIACTEPYAEPAENGHLVAVALRVATLPEMAQEDWASYFQVSGQDFQFIGPDGVTVTQLSTRATYGCLPERELFPQVNLSPGSQYRGAVVLDLPAPNGTLIYAPFSFGGQLGWEWSF